jgi:hypothetical protein
MDQKYSRPVTGRGDEPQMLEQLGGELRQTDTAPPADRQAGISKEKIRRRLSHHACRRASTPPETDILPDLAAHVIAGRFGLPLRRAALVCELAGIGQEAV